MIGNWLTWLLNVPRNVIAWVFSIEIVQGVSLGNTIIYFGLVYLAVVYLNKFFWGKANE